MIENKQKLTFNKPLVSILMPVFNSFNPQRCGGVPLLTQAIESLLAQNYKNFELIVLDNQSSDATPTICKSYAVKDKRIRYILDIQKRYPEGGIEFAASFMKGKYCMIANDDDLWRPDYILKLVNFLEDHDEIDMVYSNTSLIDIHGRVTYRSIVLSQDIYSSQTPNINNFCIYAYKRNVIPIVFGMFRSDVFRKVLPYEPFDELRANVDNLFMMKFFLLGFRCYFIDEVLFFYRDRQRKLVPSLSAGMPGLDTPLLIWLYYVRHQLYFFKKINSIIKEMDDFPELKKIFLRCVTRDAFIKHSIGLLHWIGIDYIKDKKHRSIYAKLIKFINANFIDKGILIISFSGGSDIRCHPFILGKRLQESLQKIDSFSALLNYCVSLLSLKKKPEIVLNLESMMRDEIGVCEEEEKGVKALQKKAPLIFSKRNTRQRVFQEKKPKVSVITTSYNTGKFLRDTMKSITNQSYEDFEHIVVDGASTDDTLQILKEYPHIRLISEKDNGYLDAFRKGLAIARGEYVLQCAVSDGYIDEHWIARCVEILDRDKEVALVWGLPQYMTEQNELEDISYPQFHNVLPPQKTEFIYYWLATNFWLPEGNFCVRRRVLEACFPQYKTGTVCREMHIDPWLEFNYYFNVSGYLPYFIPMVANFGRIHKNQAGQKEIESGIMEKRLRNYFKKTKTYRRKVIFGMITHQYKDGAGEILSYQFSVSKFIARYTMLLPIKIIDSTKSLVIPILKKSPKLYQLSKRIFDNLHKFMR